MSEHLSGFISIVGPPNVGKSTLLNRMIGKKVSIVSPKPQTTRNRILGILHGDGYQMVFVDTPGIHKTYTPLHRSMVDSARTTFQEVDMILFLIELPRPHDRDISRVLNHMKKARKPVFLVLNKIDLCPKEEILPIIEVFRTQYAFEVIVPISALSGEGVDILLKELKRRLRPGPPFFPHGMATDQSEAFLLSEIIREKVYLLGREELPYATAVTVEQMEEIPGRGLLSISALIHVETDSQKAILIGKGGRMIQKIGRLARLEIEEILGTHVFLGLLVRVERNWSRDTKAK